MGRFFESSHKDRRSDDKPSRNQGSEPLTPSIVNLEVTAPISLMEVQCGRLGSVTTTSDGKALAEKAVRVLAQTQKEIKDMLPKPQSSLEASRKALSSMRKEQEQKLQQQSSYGTDAESKMSKTF